MDKDEFLSPISMARYREGSSGATMRHHGGGGGPSRFLAHLSACPTFSLLQPGTPADIHTAVDFKVTPRL